MQTQLDRATASQKANTTCTLTRERERERQKQPNNLLFRAGTNEEFHIF